jgi:hypothetical protein
MSFGSARQRFLDAAVPVKDDPAPDYLGALLKLAETVGAPASFKQRLADLKAAEDRAKAASAKAAADTVAAAKQIAAAESEIARQWKAHESKVAVSDAAHQVKMKAEIAATAKAIEVERKAVAAEAAALKQRADHLRQQLGGAV